VKKLIAYFLILGCLSVLLPLSPVSAEVFQSPENGFSIDPPAPWKQVSQASFQGGVVSYAKEGSTALFHVTARDMEEAKTLDQLKWEDLFSPQFDSIAVGTEGEALIGGEKAKYCVYTIKPGPFKAQMEGKIPAKYINYVLIRGNKILSITFVDTLDGFGLDYASFLAAVRTVRFGEVKPVPAPRKDKPAEPVKNFREIMKERAA
jgi:hypothetical protein